MNKYEERICYVLVNKGYVYINGSIYYFGDKVEAYADKHYSYEKLTTAKAALRRLRNSEDNYFCGDNYFLSDTIYAKNWQLKKIIYRTALEILDIN